MNFKNILGKKKQEMPEKINLFEGRDHMVVYSTFLPEILQQLEKAMADKMGIVVDMTKLSGPVTLLIQADGFGRTVTALFGDHRVALFPIASDAKAVAKYMEEHKEDYLPTTILILQQMKEEVKKEDNTIGFVKLKEAA